MRVITGKSFNTALGHGLESRISWDDFKTILLNRGYRFDDTDKVFYHVIGGVREDISMFSLETQAYYFGFYESLDDYIDRDNIILIGR